MAKSGYEDREMVYGKTQTNKQYRTLQNQYSDCTTKIFTSISIPHLKMINEKPILISITTCISSIFNLLCRLSFDLVIKNQLKFYW